MAASIPIKAYVASIMGGTAVNQSSPITATIDLRDCYDAIVPLECQFSNVSADPVISFYRSTDGGTSFETQAMFSTAIGRIATGRGRLCVQLSRGFYAVQLLNSGPNTATFFVGTQEVLTAFETV